MTEPVAVIVRFNGDPDHLLARFETARRLWIEAQQDEDYPRPVFYAACRTDDGIVIVSAWHTQADHQAFGRRMGPHLQEVGMGHPDKHEHLSIAKLGWD
jgi:hypothetical protein